MLEQLTWHSYVGGATLSPPKRNTHESPDTTLTVDDGVDHDEEGQG